MSTEKMKQVNNKIIKKFSPSKINLFLKIKRKRKDGYHEIETVFLPLKNPSDILTITPSVTDTISIMSSDKELPCDFRNLCWKAVEAYCNKANKIRKATSVTGRKKYPENINSGWTIHIKKNIPVSAGMGGGSSNAAVILKMLQEEYNALSEEMLFELALKTGADVPFFMNPTPVLAKGIGEKIQPIEIAGNGPPLLIVAPMFPVDSGWAYKISEKYIHPKNKGKDNTIRDLLTALKKGDWEACAHLMCNDLACGVFQKFPILRMLKESLLKKGALGVEMTGSGPTLFAVYHDLDKATTAGKKIEKEYSDAVKCFPTFCM